MVLSLKSVAVLSSIIDNHSGKSVCLAMYDLAFDIAYKHWGDFVKVICCFKVKRYGIFIYSKKTVWITFSFI